jgi:hypothetical protein
VSDKITAEVEGGPETQAALAAFAAKAEQDTEAAAKAAAVVASAASSLAPVRTGALAASYTVADVYVVNPLPYAGPIEYGTDRMAAQNVVHNAWEAAGPQVVEAYEQVYAANAKALGFETTNG